MDFWTNYYQGKFYIPYSDLVNEDYIYDLVSELNNNDLVTIRVWTNRCFYDTESVCDRNIDAVAVSDVIYLPNGVYYVRNSFDTFFGTTNEVPFEYVSNSFYYHPEFPSIVSTLFIICLVVVFLISKLFKTLFFGFKRT